MENSVGAGRENDDRLMEATKLATVSERKNGDLSSQDKKCCQEGKRKTKKIKNEIAASP